MFLKCWYERLWHCVDVTICSHSEQCSKHNYSLIHSSTHSIKLQMVAKLRPAIYGSDMFQFWLILLLNDRNDQSRTLACRLNCQPQGPSFYIIWRSFELFLVFFFCQSLPTLDSYPIRNGISCNIPSCSLPFSLATEDANEWENATVRTDAIASGCIRDVPRRTKFLSKSL